ncbi:hypothetical protein HDA32_003229 [Spinactinospora alkalitolerans]|uniref:DUF2207 domain-containing protein n=1 Tax=Spinactinospora alkalitolerans TaxID=687207 RepID=A0A852TVR6_9ACTN|nr:DUF2207 domain-containing protein [Spinactinospora alkalitolerans]NYE48109.1 hypothetical protein [Spinactinospora alkalitolerans]
MPPHIAPLPILRRLRALLPAAVLAATALAPAAASASEERVTSYAADAEVRRDGSMRVTERITYDFTQAPDRHGPVRLLPRERGGGTFERESFSYSDIEVQSPDAPAAVETEDDGHDLTLRIGDPGTEVTGVHDYVISYVVTGALDHADTGQGVELDWNFIGDEWDAPVERAEITVRTPTPVTDVRCGGHEDHCRASSADRAARVVWHDIDGWPGTPVVLGLSEGPIDEAGLGTASPYTPTLWGSAIAVVLLLPLPLLPLATRPRGGGGSGSVAVHALPPAVAAAVATRGAQSTGQARRITVATLVDLHMRGLLRIERRGPDWWIEPGPDHSEEASTRMAGFERLLVEHVTESAGGGDGDGEAEPGCFLGSLGTPRMLSRTVADAAREEAVKYGLLHSATSPMRPWIVAVGAVGWIGSGACLLSMLGPQPWPLLDGAAYAFAAAALTGTLAGAVTKRSPLTPEGELVRRRVHERIKGIGSDPDTGFYDPALRAAFGLRGIQPHDIDDFTRAARKAFEPPRSPSHPS